MIWNVGANLWYMDGRVCGERHGLAHPCSQGCLSSTHPHLINTQRREWSGSWEERQCVVWRECSKRPALGSVYTRSSSVACACIVCVNYYITKYHITTTLVTPTWSRRASCKKTLPHRPVRSNRPIGLLSTVSVFESRRSDPKSQLCGSRSLRGSLLCRVL